MYKLSNECIYKGLYNHVSKHATVYDIYYNIHWCMMKSKEIDMS